MNDSTRARDLAGAELREAVLDLVQREFGVAVMMRYISENFSIPGRDYTAERQRQQDQAAAGAATEVAEHGEEYKAR